MARNVQITVKDYSKKIIQELKDKLEEKKKESLEIISNNIKEVTPVDTGRLVNSIQTDENSVFTEVEYAHWVEYGTSKQAPAAMFRRGLEASIDEINKLIQDI